MLITKKISKTKLIRNRKKFSADYIKMRRNFSSIILTHNGGHDILRLFDGLQKFSFVASETGHDY